MIALTHEELAGLLSEGLLEAEDLIEDGLQVKTGGSSQETALFVTYGKQYFVVTVRESREDSDVDCDEDEPEWED